MSLCKLFVATLLFLFSNVSSSALLDRGGGMVYDTSQGITWLADPNLGQASAFDDGDSATDGRMTLSAALAWAASLNYGGLDDWRLPTVPIRDPSCTLDNTAVNYGYGCTGNELGFLFYVAFGAAAGQAVSASKSPDLLLFGPIADGPGAYGYWFDSPWCCGNFASFRFDGGELSYGVAENQRYAWAVRTGDVMMVPEPSALTLSIAALVVLFFFSARHGDQRFRAYSLLKTRPVVH